MKICNEPYHGSLGYVQDCEPNAPCRSCLIAEVRSLRELRDALVESMGTQGGIPMTDRLADALAACGVEA